MKVVLDSNLLVSAIEFGGKPDTISKLIISRKVVGYISEDIINEVLGILDRKFTYLPVRLVQIRNFLRAAFVVVITGSIPRASRDPKDDHILAITNEQKIDFIITGDKDLLVLRQYRNVPIITVNDFLQKYET